MKYYMIITNKFDYDIDVKNKFAFAGFPMRNKSSVQEMKKGDKIVFYVSKVSKFCAVVDVIGEFFESYTKVWNDDGDPYAARIKTKPVKFVKNYEGGVYIKDIWNDLEFITNKHKWGSQVMGSFRKLSKHDYDVISKSIKGDK